MGSLVGLLLESNHSLHFRRSRSLQNPLELERRANARPNTFTVIAYVVMLVIIVGAGALFAYMTGLIKPFPQPIATAVATQNADVAVAQQAISGLFIANSLQSAKASTVPTTAGSAQPNFRGASCFASSSVKNARGALPSTRPVPRM